MVCKTLHKLPQYICYLLTASSFSLTPSLLAKLGPLLLLRHNKQAPVFRLYTHLYARKTHISSSWNTFLSDIYIALSAVYLGFCSEVSFLSENFLLTLSNIAIYSLHAVYTHSLFPYPALFFKLIFYYIFDYFHVSFYH